MRSFYIILNNLKINKCLFLIVFAAITDTMSVQFLTPVLSSGITEFFRFLGNNCCLVFDDLTKHSVAYRQLSLFLRKPAGREAFPSDIFFLHARLLERACCLNLLSGGGTTLCFPIIETLSNDLSGYVATNIISITDGQVYIDQMLFGVGICPAVSLEKSVSRVGAKSVDML